MRSPLSGLTATLGNGVARAKLEELVVLDSHHGMTSRKSGGSSGTRLGNPRGFLRRSLQKRLRTSPIIAKASPLLHLHEAEANFYQILHPENPGLAPDALLLQKLSRRPILIRWRPDGQRVSALLAGDDCSVETRACGHCDAGPLSCQVLGNDRLLGDLAWVRPRTKRSAGLAPKLVPRGARCLSQTSD